ncbi:unnamed protein product, partial [Staurois parvus]
MGPLCPCPNSKKPMKKVPGASHGAPLLTRALGQRPSFQMVSLPLSFTSLFFHQFTSIFHQFTSVFFPSVYFFFSSVYIHFFISLHPFFSSVYIHFFINL